MWNVKNLTEYALGEPSFNEDDFKKLFMCEFECEPLTEKQLKDIEEFKKDEADYFARRKCRLNG